jgi:hypothetical protein
MVREDSAFNRTRHENMCSKIPIEADHSGLVKFKSRQDVNYINVESKLKSLVNLAPSLIMKRLSPLLSEDKGKRLEVTLSGHSFSDSSKPVLTR